MDYISGDQFNNLLRFGQPFDPNNHLTGQFYRHDLEGSVASPGPTVISDQENVMTQGYGSKFNFDDFDLVRDLRSGAYSSQLQEGQTYTLSDLQTLGISRPVIGSNGQDYGDHALSTDLYGTDSPYPGTDRPAEMAYIFGSVRYRNSEDTTFRIVDVELVVNGHIELFDDNFNHVGGRHPWVSAIVHVGAGDYAAFPKVVILYEGEGAERSISQVIPWDSCFGPEVPIDMWPLEPEFAPDPKNPFKRAVRLIRTSLSLSLNA